MSLADDIRDAQLPPPERRKAIRVEAGVTQRQVAEHVGVNDRAIQKWESGITPQARFRAAYGRLLRDLEAATARASA